MKHLRFFENSQNKHDALLLNEYMIIRFFDTKGTINLIKIISKSNQSDSRNFLFSQINNLTYDNKTLIYYRYLDNRYFYGDSRGNECEILWCGFDEEDARNFYDMTINTKKFNI